MQGISITCDNKDKLDLIRKYDGQKGFNFVKITKLPSENVQVLVTADQVSDFKNQLKSNGIDYKVNIQDAQKLVDKESKEQNLAQKKKPRSFSRPFINFDFSYFPRQAIVSIKEKFSNFFSNVSYNFFTMTRERIRATVELVDELSSALTCREPRHVRSELRPAATFTVALIRSLIYNNI